MKEHRKAFSDIEESIEALYKTKNKASNKETKPKKKQIILVMLTVTYRFNL